MSRWLAKADRLRRRGGPAADIVDQVRRQQEAAAAMRAGLDARLAAAASTRLGFAVRFVRWDHDARTGMDTPVFAVDAEHRPTAAAAGLTLEEA